jgi:hypothetical protein
MLYNLKYKAKNLDQNSKQPVAFKNNNSYLKASYFVMHMTAKIGKNNIIDKNLILDVAKNMKKYGFDEKSTSKKYAQHTDSYS